MSGDGVPQSASEMSNPQFMMGMIHQSLTDLKQTVEKMVTRHEFEAVQQQMRDHVAGDKETHSKLDTRLDVMEKQRERVIGIMIGVGLVSGGVSAAVVTAVKAALGA